MYFETNDIRSNLVQLGSVDNCEGTDELKRSSIEGSKSGEATRNVNLQSNIVKDKCIKDLETVLEGKITELISENLEISCVSGDVSELRKQMSSEFASTPEPLSSNCEISAKSLLNLREENLRLEYLVEVLTTKNAEIESYPPKYCTVSRKGFRLGKDCTTLITLILWI